MEKFSVRKYKSIPDYRALDASDHDQFDYLAINYEFSILASNDTVNILSYVFYIVIDYYEKEKNATFNICYEKDTGNTYFASINTKNITNKNLKSKTILLSNYDKVKFKRQHDFVFQHIQYKDFDTLFNEFITNEILPELYSWQTNFVENKISFEKEEFNRYVKDFTDFMKKIDLISHFADRKKEINSTLLANYLENNILSNNKKTTKIKI